LLVFPNKIPFKKWTLSQANLEKVVQVLESDAASRSWKLATVEKVFEDSDKLVRKVLVVRLGADSVQEVPVHRIRIIVSKADTTEETAGDGMEPNAVE